MKQIYKIFICICCCSLICNIACTRKDIQPEPIGEPNPYEEMPQGKVRDVLKEEYKLFFLAWQKAEMDKSLEEIKMVIFPSPYTNIGILALHDSEMLKLGYSENAINDSKQDDMLKFLAPYVILSKITQETLIEGSATDFKTFMEHYLESGNFSPSYNVSVLKFQDSIFVNGLGQCKVSELKLKSDGLIIPTKKALILDTQALWAFIQQDDRFTYYREAIRINDSIYSLKDEGRARVLLSPINLFRSRNTRIPTDIMTVFLPSDKAFKASGFNSIEDIRKVILRSPLKDPITLPQRQGQLYFPSAMDTLLAVTKPYDRGQFVYDRRIFLSDLIARPDLFSGLQTRLETINLTSRYIDLEFKNDAGRLGIRRKGSNGPWIHPSVEESNIRFYKAVVHVIHEGLFLPDKY